MATKHPTHSATQQMSEDTRMIIVVILLVFAYPIGVLMMFLWTRWPKWVKILITAPIILAVVAVIGAMIILVTIPSASTHSDSNYQQMPMPRQDNSNTYTR